MSAIRSDKGRLMLDFKWKGIRCREYIGLDDTKDGRAKTRSKKLQIDGEIEAGTFEFAKWFPKSKQVKPGHRFAPPPPEPTSAPEGPPTFATFAREWLDRQKAVWSNAHYADQQSLLNTHLRPFFGDERPMSAFTVEDVEDFRTYLTQQKGLKGETLSAVRVNKARALLSKILDRAVKNKKKWLEVNPVPEVKRLKEKKAVIDPLSFEEVKLLLTKGFTHDPEMRRFYTVAIFTGLRTSEQIGLKWDDITWTSMPPTADIVHSYTKLDRLHLPKTDGSARTIALRPQVVHALKEQKAASRLKSDFVFCNSLGGPLDRDNLMNRCWYPALRRAEIKARKPYQTRHTFATLAVASGEKIGWVAEQLGHADTEMIIRHYHKHIPNLTRQDGSALDKAAAQAGL
jgi:integrase